MATLRPEDAAQIQSTIEMFEVITMSSPDDYQSMEILKEAYVKIGNEQKAIEISQKIAQAYVGLGQISAAIFEYEGILQKQPDNVDVLMLLGELEAKMSEITRKSAAPTDASGNVDTEAEELHNRLIETANTKGTKKAVINLEGDPNEPFIKYLAKQGTIAQDKLDSLAKRASGLMPKVPGEIGAPLIDIMAEQKIMSVDQSINFLIDRTKIGYVPLDHYDVDRNIVKLLPQEITCNRLIVPFDKISRTMMVALVNPFDEVGRQAVQQNLEYNIHWYLTSPQGMIRILKQIYKIK
ncbi:MAG: hypothetical protein SFY92_06805 [Verrucomicrobiae bacterium]|nr:hypothetical protein [Verrucomicrobiae bacterium]